MQSLTLSISPNGVNRIAQDLVIGSILSALKGIKPPDKRIKPPRVLTGTDPELGSKYWDDDIVIDLTNGILNSYTPVFQDIKQKAGGLFDLSINGSKPEASYRWMEQYNDYEETPSGYYNRGHIGPNNFDYKVAIGSFEAIVTLKLSYDSQNWSLKVADSIATINDPSSKIPSQSVVNFEMDCFKAHLKDATKNAVKAIDLENVVKSALEPVFVSIPGSGHLTPKIIFEFYAGDSGLSFPSDNGISIGITGNVTYNGTAYAQRPAPVLSLPPIPEKKHLHYYVSDYEFNALFWAYYNDGALHTLVTQGSVPDPAPLNTRYYKTSAGMKPLYNAYPNTPMSVNIDALQTPTIDFQKIYDLNESGLNTLKKSLPEDICEKLLNIKDMVYLTEETFYEDLKNVLEEADAAKYKAKIENAAYITGSIVHHKNKCIMNVIKSGKTIPVITFHVEQKDALQDFGLGISGQTQTLQFKFQIIPEVEIEFVSSTIDGITSENFGDIWLHTLEPIFANEVQKMGTSGVPLPRIKGFDFLCEDAQVQIFEGYASVLTNIKYTG